MTDLPLGRAARARGFSVGHDVSVSGEDADLDAALELILEIARWIEFTPEPEIDDDTAVKWEESIAVALAEMSARSKSRLKALLNEWDRTARAPQEFTAAWREVITDAP